MPKALNAETVQVNLQFTADTAQAKKQLEALQQILRKITLDPGQGFNIDEKMAKASRYAAELSVHLQKATNAKTGALDFSKLSQQLQQSKKTLSEYGESLIALGPQGRQAFQQLATSVANSEIPIRRMNASLQQMGTVLKNTIRWQLSSSAIHAVSGAINSAYRYAQDLNESLNNIRIVTGQNVDEMERYAVAANKAAKALSTSTLDYTNAALIYYQQGLSQKEADERTRVTIKMANVTRQSAEEVSSQMTAIWNNFADGSDNLEHFADVITVLGRTTASSSAEIAEGLQKFAAIGETVGLSYDYATSALATIVATTRQSADIVGNSLKTLFSRLQGLKLGETLDDGTDLNKYSKALDTVGVKIKNQNGDLKDMDTILEETAAKWQTLGKDQKMALAQTVGGLRQYTQFITLMDNWNVMQKNLQTARGSAGALQEQQDIYAESWEAASKRVKTAMQSVYDSLLDDKFFIKFLDFTEKQITGINNLIQAMGGIPGVLTTIGFLITKIGEQSLVAGLGNMATTLKTFTASGRASLEAQRSTELNNLADTAMRYSTGSPEEQSWSAGLVQQIGLQDELSKKAASLSDVETKVLQLLLDQVAARRQAAQEAAKTATQAQNEFDDIKASQTSAILGKNSNLNVTDVTKMQKKLLSTQNTQEFYKKFDPTEQMTKEGAINWAKAIVQRGRAESGFAGASYDKEWQKIESYAQGHIKTLNEVYDMQQKVLGAQTRTYREAGEAIDNYNTKANDHTAAQTFIAAEQKKTQAINANTDAQKTAEQTVENYKKALNELSSQQMTWQQGIVLGAQTLMSFGMAMSAIKGTIDTLKNEDISFFDKFVSVAMTAGMVIPSLISGFGNVAKVIKGVASSMGLATMETIANTVATRGNFTEEQKNFIIKQAATIGISKKTAAENLDTVAVMLLDAAEEGLNVTLGTTLALLGPYLIALAAVAAVIAGVVVALKTVKENSIEAQLERSTEASKNLKTQLDQVTDSVNSLSSAWEKYGSVQERLSKLTRGTTEWNEALRENNEIVLDLLDKYPELGQYVSIDSSGKYSLYKDQVENVIALKTADQLYLQNSNLIAKANTSFLQAQKEVADVEKAIETQLGYLGGAYSEAGVNIAAVKTIKNGIASNQTNTEILQTLVDNWGIEFGEEMTRTLNRSIDTIRRNGTTNTNEVQTQFAKNAFGQAAIGNTNAYQQADSDTQRLFNLFSNQFMRGADISKWGTGFVDEYGTALTGEQAAERYRKAFNLSADTKVTDEEAFTYLNSQKYTDLIQNQVSAFQTKIDTLPPVVRMALLGDLKELSANGITSGNLSALYRYQGNFEGILGHTGFLDFIEGLKNAKVGLEGTTSTSELQTKYQEIDRVFDKVKKGDTVKAEDYDKLSDAAKSYFQKMEDGTYKLTEDADKLQATLAKGRSEDYLKNVKQLQDNATSDSWGNGLSEDWGTEMQANVEGAFAATTSLEQLHNVKEKLNALGVEGVIVEEAEKNALINLGLQYDSCADEVEKLKQSLATGNEELVKQAKDALEAAINVAELAEKMSLSANDIEDQARAFRQTNTALKDDIKTSTKMAVLNQSMNKGITTLVKNWKEWNKAIRAGDKTSMDYIDAVQGMRSALKDLVGVVDEDFIPKDFLDAPENMELIEKAAKGDTDAINKLGVALAKAQVEDFANPFENMGDTDLEQFDFEQLARGFEENRAIVQNGIDELLQSIQDGSAQAGQAAAGMGENWVNALNEMAIDTGMSVAQMNSMLNELGVQAEVKSVIKPVTQRVPRYITTTTILSEDEVKGTRTTATTTHQDGFDTFTGEMEVAQINTGSNIGSAPIVSYAGRANAAPSAVHAGDKGGGGSKAQNYKKEEYRYKSQTEKINDLEKALNKVSKAKDRAFGYQRVNLINQEIAALDKEITAQEELIGQVKDYINIDKNRLLNGEENAFSLVLKDAQQATWHSAKSVAAMLAESGTGVSLAYDEFGNIANIEAIKTALNQWYNLQVDKYNTGKNEDEWAIAQEQHKWAMHALQQYGDSVNKLAEEEDKLQEEKYQKQDYYAEQLNTRIEHRIQLEKNELALITSSLTLLNGSLFKGVEIFNLMRDQLSKSTVNASELREDYEKWLALKDDISDEEYRAGLQQVFDSSGEAIEDLMSQINDLSNYYSDFIGKFDNMMKFETKKFDILIEELEYYNELASLTGHEKDYNSMLKVLDSEKEVVSKRLEVNKALQIEYQSDYDKIIAQYDKALKDRDTEMIDFLRPSVEAAKNLLDETNSQIREDIKELAELAQKEFSTALDKIYYESEQKLTNNLGFDLLSQTMDLASKQADEYLTKTNQIYETNQMLRDIANDINKTNNKYAKTQLNNFSKEIVALQSKKELSHYELEDAKARYEVLKAQIALEEAQNAKSTVRLQRDNEGNYGYVYTADRDKIKKAEDDLAKASNDRYNLALKTQQDYLRKFYDTEREANEALRKLDEDWAAGRITDENVYRTKKQEIIEYYGNILKSYEQTNTRALQVMNETAAQHINDSWTNTFGADGYGLIGKSQEWEKQSTEDAALVQTALETLADSLSAPGGPIEEYNNLSTAADNATTEAEELRKELVDEFLPWVDSIKDGVIDIAAGYDGLYNSIHKTLEELQLLNKEMGKEAGEIRESGLATYTAHAEDGSTYTIHSEKGNRFIEDSTQKELIGGDNSHWVRNDNGSVSIFKNGKEYRYNGTWDKVEEIENKNIQTADTPISSPQSSVGYSENDVLSAYRAFNSGQRLLGSYSGEPYYAALYALMEATYQGSGKFISSDVQKAWDIIKHSYGFASGGYTGEWGTFGKLAMLHEKELVLNADDTRNMLAAVQLVREISNAIDLQAQATGASSSISTSGLQSLGQTVEQVVTIHAEFPNATNHSEIEQAFDNLINRASQYANRY